MDCDDATRRERLTHDWLQPELASESMMGWASFLRQEALDADCDILDATDLGLAQSVGAVLAILERHRS